MKLNVNCRFRGWMGRTMVLGIFLRRGILLVWIIAEQGPTVLAVGVGGSCLDIYLPPLFSLFCFLLSGAAQ